MNCLFGPAGNSNEFYQSGLKATVSAPKWLSEYGLDAYEYQAGNGLYASDATLKAIGDEAKKYNIKMSLHSPYYISLSGIDVEKRLKSLDYIEKCIHASELLGADTIVIHTGSASKISRQEALGLAKDTMYKALEKFPDAKVNLGLETMGKLNQLGTLDEVIELCKMDERLYPVVDFGHLNSRNIGGLFVTEDDYYSVFDKIGSNLSDEKAKNLHCHFSKIEYTNSGEKKHLTFEDEVFGPRFEPLIETIVKHSLSPRIICESDGTMARDAKAMKDYYEKLI